MLRVAPLLSPLGRKFESWLLRRDYVARVVTKACPRRKFGTYPLSTRNDFAVFRTQDQSYRHLSLRSGSLFVPKLKSYWDGNRAGRRFSSAFNSV